ncbi:pilus assembly protein CpaE [Rhizobium sp. SG_E_25_P2]|uniref:AAA family ATPase n=1 Tax=Rhizobium sp. SG_E_25_P2 TaxID=2879942 RepID=UPI002474D3FD|nr:CpaE family protein [Rhizobium sp. SG_E_25_P2]MDH6265327.1 pilus assembly protein CpaE [Rhizobium sp. SG_E_25_P2]
MNAVEYGIHRDEGPVVENEIRPGDLDQLRPLPRISVHAFCETENMYRLMEKLAQDRRMAKVSFRINQGSTEAAVNMFSGAPTPNLILLETSSQPDVMMHELAPLAEVCDPTTKVVIVGRYNDIPLYRDLIRNGISEYMVSPISLVDVIAAISAIFVDPDAEPLGRSIAFIGAKGGVGSSTIAHNIAWGVSSLFASEVILADLDFPFGTANIDFDQDPAQGIAEAVYSPERLDDMFLDRLLTKCSEHLSLLAAPSVLDRAYDFDRSAFQPVLEILQRATPVSVLDVPHAWSDWTRTLLADVDEVVVTAAPDLANLRNAKNMFDQLRKLRPNDRPPHLILNQVGLPKRPEIATADFCEPLEIEPIAIIPFDASLFGSAANSGRMIGEMDSKSPVAEVMSQIAHIVTGRVSVKKAKKSALGSILGKLTAKK